MVQALSVFRSVFSKEAFNMETNPLDVVRALGPSLVPFFKTVAIYFVLEKNITNRPLFAVIKCLPVISLIVFVVMHHRTRLAPKKMGDLRQLQLLRYDFDSSSHAHVDGPTKVSEIKKIATFQAESDSNRQSKSFNKGATGDSLLAGTSTIQLEPTRNFIASLRSADSRYARMVLFGLLLSLAGDVCLVWSAQLFLYGLILFALAHCAYAAAFSFTPLNPFGFVFVLLVGIAYHWVMQVNFTGIYAFAAPCYSALIGTMLWRAISRLKLGAAFWEWTAIASCFGGSLFAVSDALLGIDRFAGGFAHIGQFIMITYYAAQFGIAVSVIDTHRYSSASYTLTSSSSSSSSDLTEKKND